jgi:hypothetical protein
MVRTYKIGDRTFSKVSANHLSERPVVHVVEDGQFWKGNKSWEHRAVCGGSISGTPVQLMRVSCVKCRVAIRKIIKEQRERDEQNNSQQV